MRAGALFAGYGGLELAISALWPDTELVWYSEVDPHAIAAMEAHWPGVENLGDVTKIDWSTAPDVEVMGGGFPCQDLSSAGKRRGLREGTRSGLWYQFREGIRVKRPRVVVIENVRGLLYADAHSDLGCDGCVETVGDKGALLRALGAVLGDLADIGYDASWYGLRAADVGAPHGRFRVFIVAYPQGSPPDTPQLGPEWGVVGASGGWTGPEDGSLLPTPRATDGPHGSPGQRGSSGDLTLPAAVHPTNLLPTPTGRDGKDGTVARVKSRPDDVDTLARALTLLPTPTAVDMGGNKTPEEWDEWTDEMRERHNNGRGHGNSLNVEVQRLLPTPTLGDGGHSSDGTMFHGLPKLLPTPQAHDSVQGKTPEQVAEMRARGHGVANLNEVAANELITRANPNKWGDYAEAIARWERILGREAPDPTMLNSKGAPQLAPRFVEWMMGLDPGWVVDHCPTRNTALERLGNGVCPQQAAVGIVMALRLANAEVESAWRDPGQQKSWSRALRREMRKKK